MVASAQAMAWYCSALLLFIGRLQARTQCSSDRDFKIGFPSIFWSERSARMFDVWTKLHRLPVCRSILGFDGWAVKPMTGSGLSASWQEYPTHLSQILESVNL